VGNRTATPVHWERGTSRPARVHAASRAHSSYCAGNNGFLSMTNIAGCPVDRSPLLRKHYLYIIEKERGRDRVAVHCPQQRVGGAGRAPGVTAPLSYTDLHGPSAAHQSILSESRRIFKRPGAAVQSHRAPLSQLRPPAQTSHRAIEGSELVPRAGHPTVHSTWLDPSRRPRGGHGRRARPRRAIAAPRKPPASATLRQRHRNPKPRQLHLQAVWPTDPIQATAQRACPKRRAVNSVRRQALSRGYSGHPCRDFVLFVWLSRCWRPWRQVCSPPDPFLQTTAACARSETIPTQPRSR
jgi:hypothetical protein